ncbi:MAG TPA: hypothetical protein VJL29_03670 [Thermoguttaceae bacterium]|nr:hypothetical protein [Thermoguttaceae bacterium]
MTTTVGETQGVFGVDSEHGTLCDETVRTRICGLLASFRPRQARLERRGDQRYPFPYLLQLTPVDEDGTPSGEETVVVVGKHISEEGIGFYHNRPLPYRRMIVSFEAGNGSSFSFLVDLTWCRFTKQGWYESGGRFLEPVETPPTGR